MQPVEVGGLITAALDPRHFFVAPGGRVQVTAAPDETTPWELFRGHLLDAHRTRLTRRFRTWHVHFAEGGPVADESAAEPASPAAPLVSVRWDEASGELHVTRNLLSRGWEALETRPGVIESRPILRWLPELVASIDARPAVLAARGTAAWSDELRCCLGLAWWGASRLPITSVEAPHPMFSLGRLAYLPDVGGEGTDDPVGRLARSAWLDPHHPDAPRRLETALRAADPADVPAWFRDWPASATDPALRSAQVDLLRRLFHQVSLSPFTQFTACWLRMLDAVSPDSFLGEAAVIDLLGYMIRHLVRHLSAYDLVTFHSFGANYPDALWLDQLFQALSRRVDARPELFLEESGGDGAEAQRRRLRRRALRLGWLVRRSYEGHRVPDVPTSRGEHQRVLPGHWPQAPEEQITHPETRRKRLYADDPTAELLGPRAQQVLEAALADLVVPDEMRELGAATFLDRPCGIFKPPGAVDRTPLLAYDAASHSLAARRLAEIRRSGVSLQHASSDVWDALLDALPRDGILAADLPGESRPGVIMLEDARQAGADFIIRSIRPGSLRQLAACPGMWSDEQRAAIAAWSRAAQPLLLVRSASVGAARSGQPWLTCYDTDGRTRGRCRLARPGEPAYAEAYGIEYLRDGLRLEG